MSTTATSQLAAFDVATIKAQFPLLRRTIDGRPIHYLDSANTSQKPAAVIEAMTQFTETSYAPINRSAYRLAAEATDAFEGARVKAQRFINAPNADEWRFCACGLPLDSCCMIQRADAGIPPWTSRRSVDSRVVNSSGFIIALGCAAEMPLALRNARDAIRVLVATRRNSFCTPE